MSELKNCPFCGGEVKIQPEVGYHAVYCETCGVELNRHGYEDAVTAWNTRTAAPRFTAEEREALHCVRYLATVLFDAAEGQDKRQDKRYTQSIATVRKMLED